NTKPAIFGVRVSGGKLIKNLHMINEEGEKVGNIKNIQHEKNSVNESHEGDEVAISIPNLNYERQMKGKKYIYSDTSESQFRNFKENKDLLTGTEMQILKEISGIKRKEKPEWGV
ncbi:MAG: translation initiation factor IF-2, partial [Nanoarchaeota archaeon]|nr:translation initiation factor IF-2 [Nanoarchaeota archaeon]